MRPTVPVAVLLIAACSGGSSSSGITGTNSSTGAIGGHAFLASSAVAAVTVTEDGPTPTSQIRIMVSDQPVDCAGLRASSAVLGVSWTQQGTIGAGTFAIGHACDKCNSNVSGTFIRIDSMCSSSNPDAANQAGMLSIDMSDGNTISGSFDSITFPDGTVSGTFLAQVCDSFAAGFCH
jgi:hypothetical protein